MLGKGLESLIPPGGGNVSKPSDQKPDVPVGGLESGSAVPFHADKDVLKNY